MSLLTQQEHGDIRNTARIIQRELETMTRQLFGLQQRDHEERDYEEREQQRWRISTNRRLYNINQLREGKKLHQSKGRARMRPQNRPRLGDLAYVAYGGWRRALCLVITDDWQNGIAHQQDPGNRGLARTHANIKEFATLVVLSLLPEGLLPLRGCQRTWTHV